MFTVFNENSFYVGGYPWGWRHGWGVYRRIDAGPPGGVPGGAGGKFSGAIAPVVGGIALRRRQFIVAPALRRAVDAPA